MLTPQEVAQRSFHKASFGGYNMAMVDDFLDEVTRDYEALFNENALLKQKMGLLSGKLREYQNTEESMRRAMVTAQEALDAMKEETRAECEQMLAQAREHSAVLQKQYAVDLSGEEHRLMAARGAVETFKDQIRAACRQQMEFLERLDQLVPPPDDAPADKMEQTVEEIQAAVERSVAEDVGGRRLAAEPQDASEEEPTVERPIPAPPAVPAPPANGEDGDVESSISLYEQLMARRRGGETVQGEHKELEFGKDFTLE